MEPLYSSNQYRRLFLLTAFGYMMSWCLVIIFTIYLIYALITLPIINSILTTVSIGMSYAAGKTLKHASDVYYLRLQDAVKLEEKRNEKMRNI